MAESLDDAALVARLRMRDTAAFAALYDRHARLAFGYAMQLLYDAAGAEAIVEHVFLRLWRHGTSDALRGATVAEWLLTSIVGYAHGWRTTIPFEIITTSNLASAS